MTVMAAAAGFRIVSLPMALKAHQVVCIWRPKSDVESACQSTASCSSGD